jgi:hypothetical protein
MKQLLFKTFVPVLMVAITFQSYGQVAPVSSPVFAANMTVKGSEAFTASFSNTSTGRNDMNAYLLCYLTTLIYPQYLSTVANRPTTAYINQLHTNPSYFESEYKRLTSKLFTNPQYSFVHKSFPNGYDPEAMVISTPQSVYVVFRGTDRVASNQVETFMYDWGEWLMSDFDARHLTTPELTGKVLAGMWLSLEYENFKESLYQKIQQSGGATKKVWITGHSLGSGQAQLFAMYMSKKGITPQGVYLYASPHAGTQEFVTALENILPGGRLQRFDFITDPVTMLAPYALGYRRAGVRVYYNDVKSMQFGAPERSAQEGLQLIPALVGAGANAIADVVNGKTNSKFKIDINTIGGSPFCYHHPLWYLRAAFNQLSVTERSKVPSPLPLPDQNLEGCDLLTVQRGRSSDPLTVTKEVINTVVDGGAAVVKEGLEVLQFVASTIFNNATGAAITEGDYYIRSYASDGKLVLNEKSGLNNGVGLKLTTTNNKVKVQRYGALGYTISFGNKTVDGFFGSETKTYVLDSQLEDLLDDGHTTVQLWEKNGAPALSANQRWLFIKVKDNKYVIKNLANGKLLDAGNSCVNNNECTVSTLNPSSNDQTQIWILEKAN